MKQVELLSRYAMCRECALEFGTVELMQEHADRTGHVIIGTEENRIIVKRNSSCIAS